ncbi:HD domain-containing protein [Deinococcus psychrotolerans]|uniref:HD domain-containing protein n=1 Tax=Deinococcus psychrotolerans TaxID=2489213 RepID=A0A3G8YA50_9DEIO|nr:HD domain-containing protein [Deinococcus psychrotolerans]AZI42035.1 HD domain-containing protein [Deinococcus psychrotolerans]
MSTRFFGKISSKLGKLPGKVKRLSRSLTASQAQPNDAWALSLLTPPEARLYLSMDARDREHACRVTGALLAAYPDSSPELSAAALLHDSGKLLRPYRVHERVLVGLVPGRAAQQLPFGALYLRGQHPAIGGELLRRTGGRERVAELVERHHSPKGDAEAALLHQFDDLE